MNESRVKTEVLSETSVKLSCQINASADRVYDAWLDGKAVGIWFAGHNPCVVEKLDAVIGGEFRFQFTTQNGLLTAFGTYLELDKPRHMAFTWAWTPMEGGVQSRVKLDFEESNGVTTLVMVHEMLADAESRELHTFGWTGCLNSVVAYIEGEGK